MFNDMDDDLRYDLEKYKELFETLSKSIESKQHELYKLKGHNCLAKQLLTSLIDLNKRMG